MNLNCTQNASRGTNIYKFNLRQGINGSVTPKEWH